MTNQAGNVEVEQVEMAVMHRFAAQVMQRCDELAACTETPGQLTRRFCTPAMKAAHEKVRAWFEAAGMTCRLDAAGNLIGRWDAGAALGTGATKSLLIGSHLDTVANAGRYDGMLGVLLGLALVELLAESGKRLPFAVDVIGFSEEEGVRHRSPYIGSRALIGDLPAELLIKQDDDGVSVGEALTAFGCDLSQIGAAEYRAEDVVAYVEPHIEQGPVLETAGLPLGIVTGIAGQTRAQFQFVGKAGHAGTAPMNNRQDALAAAAQFIGQVEQFARGRAGLTATVGQIEVSPNVANVIPGEVQLSLDVRHLDDEARDAAFRELTHQAALIAEQREIEFDLILAQHHSAVRCDAAMSDRLREAVVAAGVKPMDLASGAGHDAVMMARRFPAAMLFVRCAGGISHHPDESVTEADVAVALEVLWRFVMRLR
ncbi:MAG TPA: allantoate amidohydrolase [Pirellulales bacterium]